MAIVSLFCLDLKLFLTTFFNTFMPVFSTLVASQYSKQFQVAFNNPDHPPSMVQSTVAGTIDRGWSGLLNAAQFQNGYASFLLTKVIGPAPAVTFCHVYFEWMAAAFPAPPNIDLHRGPPDAFLPYKLYLIDLMGIPRTFGPQKISESITVRSFYGSAFARSWPFPCCVKTT